MISARRPVVSIGPILSLPGVREAILFASGEAACRAYAAIGFQRIGVYTLVILRTALKVAA